MKVYIFIKYANEEGERKLITDINNITISDRFTAVSHHLLFTSTSSLVELNDIYSQSTSIEYIKIALDTTDNIVLEYINPTIQESTISFNIGAINISGPSIVSSSLEFTFDSQSNDTPNKVQEAEIAPTD